MSTPLSSQIDQICERVDLLLTHQAQLQHDNLRLQQEVEALAQQRDALESRLAAARHRIDALLQRLPAEPSPPASAMPTSS